MKFINNSENKIRLKIFQTDRQINDNFEFKKL